MTGSTIINKKKLFWQDKLWPEIKKQIFTYFCMAWKSKNQS